ncbi:hypothetical protein PPSIR1_37319 [Plesiocystis pacifica SIR-1]|uniref:Uncharacterized protein n=2 Tax=Plesiocystis pacifica TaxID=191768 RepID=A6G0M9_9BACT|nr:hypothetical protein PPSIR1_37319 [Plesiocystis pacifica SIR-1]
MAESLAMTWNPARTISLIAAFCGMALGPLALGACSEEPAVLEGCECIPVEFGPGEPAQPSCEEALCPTVVASEGSEGSGPFVVDEDALSCALDALAQRTPGWIAWSWTGLEGQYTDLGYVRIRSDGSAVRRDWGQEDLSLVVNAAVFGELSEAASYADCLDEAEAEARFDCMRRELASVSQTCNYGWLDEGV